MNTPTYLATFVALTTPDTWLPDSCPAWIEVLGRQCGRTPVAGQHICKLHLTVARRRAQRWEEEEKTKAEKQRQQAQTRWNAHHEEWQAELDKIDARIRHLDPPAPTTDPAAWTGVGHSAERRYRARYTDTRIHELAELHDRRYTLEKLLRKA